MREVDVEGLLAGSEDPFVHHHLDRSLVRRAWLDGPAVVVEHRVAWPDAPHDAVGLLCLGPAEALDALVARVAPRVPRPWRVVAESGSEPALPDAWRPTAPHRWHWMSTRTPPPEVAGPAVVEPPGDEVDAVLDAANPGSFARPGTTGVECWLGVRGDDGRLAAVGALLRQPGDGTGHLRGITTLADRRGRGLGAVVSAALTRRALAAGPGIATLGVYTDNEVALRLYCRLGYRVRHTFVAGTTAR